MKWILQSADEEGTYPGEATNGVRLPREIQALFTVAHWRAHLQEIGISLQQKDFFSKCLSNATKRERGKATNKSLIDRVKGAREVLRLINDASSSNDNDDDESEEAQQPGLMLYRATSEEECANILAWFTSQKQAVEDLLNNDKFFAELNDADAAKKIAKLFEKDKKILPISGHLGDVDQARTYIGTGKKYQRLLRFTLKPGAHKILFDPRYTVFGPGTQTHIIESCMDNSGSKPSFCSGNSEGISPGYIGLKCEENGTSFSVAMVTSEPTHFLFQLLIANVEDITDEQTSTSTNSTSTSSTRATSSTSNMN